MTILLITQWYAPIKGAGARRTSKMARFLSEMGHQVTVLTGMPSYPLGILPQKYRWKLWAKEKDKKIKIIRTYEFPAPNRGVIKRLINNFSFLVSATLAALILPRHDAVIVSSPSFTSGIAGLVFKKIHQCDFYFDVRDLWPDSVIEMGLLKGDLSIKIFKWLERQYYKNAEKIFVATPGIKRHLVKEKWPEEKVITLLNSVDTELFKPQKNARRRFHLQEKDFILSYIGNHSRLYDLETVVKTAKLLKNYPIKFIFVGEGEEKEKLVKTSQDLNLKNVEFLKEKDASEIAALVSSSDATLIPLSKVKVTQESMPMKASEYFASAKPVIASISGDMKKFIEEFQAGLIYPSGDTKKLAQAILKLYRNKPLRQKMGLSGRKLALKVFSDLTFKQILRSTFPGLPRK